MILKLDNRSQSKTLLEALHASDDLALVYLETEAEPIILTRADVLQSVQQYAAALHGLGVGNRDLVIIAHTQNLESIFAFWGALWLGAIPSMFPTLTEKLDPDIYMSNMALLVEHSAAKAILTTDDFAPQLAARVACPVYGSEHLLASVGDAKPAQQPAEASEIAFLQHSSGTTGLQKGIALSHEAVLNQVASYSEALNLTEKDVVVSWLPLYHDMGLIAGFVMPFVQGIPLVLMSPFDWVAHPAMLLRAIDEYKGTLCWLPNFAYNHCARRIRKRDTENLDLSSMRAFINCSEPVHHTSHVAFAERFAANGITLDHLTVSYAMAENTFAVTQTPVGAAPKIDSVDRRLLEEDRRAVSATEQSELTQVNVSCGRPIDNCQVQIIDDQGNALDERQVGEVAVKSDFMLSGYYKRDDLNATLWQEGWYRTGDMGYLAEGEVYIVGRKKDLIINAGKNVYPQDLEAIVNQVEGIHKGRAVAFGVYDEKEGTELIGVVAEVDDGADKDQITSEIRQRVASQTTVSISYVHLVDDKWLLKTSSGKIARAANRDKWQAEIQAQ